MGRYLPTITTAYEKFMQGYSKFRRALRRPEQKLLDDLFAEARNYLAASAYARHVIPGVTFLLSMILLIYQKVMVLDSHFAGQQNQSTRQQKQIERLTQELADIRASLPDGTQKVIESIKEGQNEKA